MDLRQFPTKQGIRLSGTPTLQATVAQKAGPDGIRQTLDYMRRFASDYKTHPVIRELALSLVANLPQKDYPGEVRACWDYVKYRVRYVRDIAGVETLQTPLKTLEYGQGDCDDKATLLACLLDSIGHETRFRAVGFRPDSYCHVLPEVKLSGQWVPLETTEPVGIGWLPQGIVSNMHETDALNGLVDSLKKGANFTVDVFTGGGSVSHPFDPKGNIVRLTSVTSEIPGFDSLMNNKALGPVLQVIGWIYPPVGAAMTIINNAVIPAYQASQQLSMKIQTAKGGVTSDGQRVADAIADKKKLDITINKYLAAADRIISLDKVAKLGIYTATSALGLAGAYILRHRR